MLNSLAEIKAATERGTDKYFFSPGTLRVWSSRVMYLVYPTPNGAVFVTSERDTSSNVPRGYTVRYCSDDGRITKVSRSQEYESRSSALNAARRHAKLLNETGETETHGKD